MSSLTLQEGHYYLCKNDRIVKVRKTNLPYYKFGVDSYMNSSDTNLDEVWDERGLAYHFDCGYNVVKEVFENELIAYIEQSKGNLLI